MFYATPRFALVMAFAFIGSIGLAVNAQAQDTKLSQLEPSLGAAPDVFQGETPVPDYGNIGSFAPSLVFGMNTALKGGDFGSFDPPLPESFMEIGPVSAADYCGAGGATPDGSTYYLICGTSLMSIDTETGDVTDLGDLGTTGTFSSMDYDATTETWYGITNVDCETAGTLVTVNIGDVSTSEVGSVTDQLCVVGMAFTPDGDLYSYDIVSDELWEIDKTTGDETNVGAIGFDANFGQGMAWDYLNETMYLTAFNVGTEQPELRSVDLGTGMSTLEWVFNADQIDAAGAPADGIAAPRPEDPTLVIDMTEIDFGTVDLGSSESAEVQLLNIGEPTLNIDAIALDDGSAGFQLDLSGTDMTLDTDESTSFLVTFEPEEGGVFSDNVTIESDDPASPATVALSGSSIDASLDEPCELDDFEVDSPDNGGEPVMLTCEGGVATQGNVVGFHFIGTASGITGNGSWASDTCMIVEAPGGDTFGVGGLGFSNTGTPGCGDENSWDFQGTGSTEDGTYESTHNDAFPEVDDAGTWTFTFINDWASTSAATISWSDVVVTLRKVGSTGTEATPEEMAEGLSVPSPNPVSASATFTVAVEQSQDVSVEVFDVMGRRLAILYEDTLPAATSETVTLDASALPAGVYVIRATGEDFLKTRRVTVVR